MIQPRRQLKVHMYIWLLLTQNAFFEKVQKNLGRGLPPLPNPGNAKKKPFFPQENVPKFTDRNEMKLFFDIFETCLDRLLLFLCFRERERK